MARWNRTRYGLLNANANVIEDMIVGLVMKHEVCRLEKKSQSPLSAEIVLIPLVPSSGRASGICRSNENKKTVLISIAD